MSIQSKLSQLVDFRDTLINTLNEYDIDLPSNSKLTTLLPYINDILVNNNIDKFIAKGRYNGDLIYTLSQDGELIVTGTSSPNNCSSNNPLYYLTSDIKSVKTIGIPNISAYMFGTGSMFNQLETVVIGEGCTVINDRAFYNCTKLTSITLPESLKRIEADYVFYNVGLKNINFPSNLEYIGQRAFDTSKLEEVTIPDKITTLYLDTFARCANLHTVNLNENLTTIEQGVFYNSDLYEINIPNNVTSIGYECFRYNRNLTNVSFGNKLKYILGRAFRDCNSLKEVILPKSLLKIEDSGFEDCSGLITVSFESANYSDDIIPDSDNNHKLLSLGTWIFYNCTSLKNVTLPNQITYLGREMFRYCRSLEEIEIPNSVTEFFGVDDGYTFSNCTSLKNVKLSNKLVDIAGRAFEYASLDFINLPKSLKLIRIGAFGQNNFENVLVPENVGYLARYAFWECKKLKECIIKAYITNIYDNTFRLCSSLEHVEIPHTVKSIDGNAFYGCTQSNLVIDIYNEEGSISGAPWGATNATINWLGLPILTENDKEQIIEEDFPIINNMIFYFNFKNKFTKKSKIFSNGHTSYYSLINPIKNTTIVNNEETIYDNNLYYIGYPRVFDNSLFIWGDWFDYGRFDISNLNMRTFYIVYKAHNYAHYNTGDRWCNTVVGTGIANGNGTTCYISSCDGTIRMDGFNSGRDSGICDYNSGYHIVCVRYNDSNNQISFYVDGTYIDSGNGKIGNEMGIGAMASVNQGIFRYRYGAFSLRFMNGYSDFHDEETILTMTDYLKNVILNQPIEEEES